MENLKIIKENRKTVKLVINKDGELIIHSPRFLSQKKLNEVITQKSSWITNKINLIKKSATENLETKNYQNILLCGRSYQIVKNSKIKIPAINDISNKLEIPQKAFDDTKIKFKMLKKWYKDIAKLIIPKRINTLVCHMGLKINSLSLGDFKRKWGSCDKAKNIKINWRLVMLSPNVIDFVLLHELCHTKELNHSSKFYKLLEEYCANHKILKKNLKESTYLLDLFRN